MEYAVQLANTGVIPLCCWLPAIPDTWPFFRNYPAIVHMAPLAIKVYFMPSTIYIRLSFSPQIKELIAVFDPIWQKMAINSQNFTL
jgi:hypothetical protein